MDAAISRNYWHIDQLKTNPNNLTEQTSDEKERQRYFYKKHGLLTPLLVDIRPEHEGEVLGGNHMLDIMREEGETQVWVEPRTPKDDAEAFELAAIHNSRFTNYIESTLQMEAEKFKDELDLSKFELEGMNLDQLVKELESGDEPETAEPVEPETAEPEAPKGEGLSDDNSSAAVSESEEPKKMVLIACPLCNGTFSQMV